MQTKILNFIKSQTIPEYDLCDNLKWNRHKISDVKNGRSRFSVDDLFLLAQFFDVSIDSILEYKPSKMAVNSFNTVNNNNNSNIHIGNTDTEKNTQFGEIEAEIHKMCAKMEMKDKIKLLMYCYEIEKAGVNK